MEKDADPKKRHAGGAREMAAFAAVVNAEPLDAQGIELDAERGKVTYKRG